MHQFLIIAYLLLFNSLMQNLEENIDLQHLDKALHSERIIKSFEFLAWLYGKTILNSMRTEKAILLMAKKLRRHMTVLNLTLIIV